MIVYGLWFWYLAKGITVKHCLFGAGFYGAYVFGLSFTYCRDHETYITYVGRLPDFEYFTWFDWGIAALFG